MDAVRKHYVRHHEEWLQTQGVDVELWRHGCVAMPRITDHRNTGPGSNGGMSEGDGGVGTVVGSSASGAYGVGGEAAGEGKKSSTRNTDGE